MNKRANVFDSFSIILTVFAIAITLVFMFYLMGKIQTKMSEQIGDVEQANQTFNEGMNRVKGTFDWINFALLALLIISVIVTSFLFWTHPLFLVLYFLSSGFLVFVSIFLSNVFDKFVSTAPLNETIALFPITNYIFSNLPIIMVVIIGLSAIIIYAKRPRSNELGEI